MKNLETHEPHESWSGLTFRASVFRRFRVSAFQRFSVSVVYLSTFCFLLSAFSLFAQDSLLLSQNGQRDADARKLELENLPYMLRWGDLKLVTGASMAGEWNDNINLSHAAPEADFLLRPQADCDLYWPVTEINILKVSFGVGYDKYLRYSENDHIIVSPGSQLSWDVMIKDFKINLHDQFSYYEDPTVNGSVSGQARFGGFENTAGVLGTWDLNDVVLSLGYDHFNFIASTTRYDYTTRASDFFTARVAARVHPGTMVGVETSAGPTAYDQAVLQNNTTYSLGAFAEWQVTDFIATQLHGGYYGYDFDALGHLPASTQTGYYLSLNYNQRLRKNISCNFEAGRQTSLGIYSSLTEQWYGQCGVDWRPLRHLSTYAGFRYETTTQSQYLQYGDNYDRMFVNLRLSTPLNKKWTASVEYRYWIKNSNLLTYQDYEQNRVTLQLAYHF